MKGILYFAMVGHSMRFLGVGWAPPGPKAGAECSMFFLSFFLSFFFSFSLVFWWFLVGFCLVFGCFLVGFWLVFGLFLGLFLRGFLPVVFLVLMLCHV